MRITEEVGIKDFSEKELIELLIPFHIWNSPQLILVLSNVFFNLAIMIKAGGLVHNL